MATVRFRIGFYLRVSYLLVTLSEDLPLFAAGYN